MPDATQPDATIDFDAAEMYLRMAREAHAKGDAVTCTAACKMITVALCLEAGPHTRFHLSHLKNA